MLQNHRNYIWAASLHIMISLFDRDQGIAISLLCALQSYCRPRKKTSAPSKDATTQDHRSKLHICAGIYY